MATEKVNFTVKVFDNFIEIIPEKGVKNNSTYEIKLNGLVSADTMEPLDNQTIKFVTMLTPMYCSVMDVESLIEIVDIREDIVLYNIREASKYAAYVYELVHKTRKIKEDNIPMSVKQYVRHKAAKDCLLKIYMSLITDNVVEGMLGEAKFKLRDKLPDIKKLLDYLDDEINKWLDAIRGYELEGRAKMQTAVRGYHHGGRNPMTGSEKRQTPKPVPISYGRGVY